MPDQPQHTLVASLLTALASRTHAEAAVLTARLRDGCWPGGDDRTDALAREWLRRRGPEGAASMPGGCTCRGGRCGVCN